MRIAIDARELCGKPTGVGRYLRGLLSAWADLREAQKHEFVLLAPTSLAAPLEQPKFRLQVVNGGNGTRWEQFALAAAVNRMRPDVFFAPAYSAPLRIAAPLVLTLHDVSFIVHPEWFRWRERVRRTWLARRSALKAAVVLVVSLHMRDEIAARLKVPISRMRIVYSGVTLPGSANIETPSGSIGTSIKASSGRPMVLFVGSIFNRRHLPDLIRAFSRIAARHPDVMLEIVGENRTYPREDLQKIVSELGLERNVRIHAYTSDEHLRELYQEARAFAFLSEYEGFGLPPLEALLAGVPVLASDTPVAREVLADAAFYAPIADLDAIARSLELLLFDEASRTRILDRAPGVLARYSWKRAGLETLAALEAAASQIPNPESRITNSGSHHL